MKTNVHWTIVARLGLPALLAFASSNTLAAWMAVGGDDNSTAFADPVTIRRQDDMVKMWSLIDFGTARVPPGGKRYAYRSSKSEYEYDCKEERLRALSFSWRSGNMGKGKVVYSTAKPGMWEPVAPDTFAWQLWRFACGKQ